MICEFISDLPVKTGEIFRLVRKERSPARLPSQTTQYELSTFCVQGDGRLPTGTETDFLNDRVRAYGTVEHLIECNGA